LAAVYSVDLAFSHDGVGGCDTIPLTLEVGENLPQPPSAFNLLEPADGSEIYVDWLDPPEEQMVTFAWQSSLDPNPEDSVGYQIWFKNLDGFNEQVIDSLFNLASDTACTINLWHLMADSLGGFQGLWMYLVWWVNAASGGDTVECDNRFRSTIIRPDGAPAEGVVPVEYGIGAIYPNPFNSEIRVRFGLDAPGEARLTVSDLTGRAVAVLLSGYRNPGEYHLTWDAVSLPSGIYILKLWSGGRSQFRKVVLAR
jgi:hypothetical protein